MLKDISGERFGRLVAIRRTSDRKNGSVVWECECDCGNRVFVARKYLMSGATKSCGCLRKAGSRKRDPASSLFDWEKKSQYEYETEEYSGLAGEKGTITQALTAQESEWLVTSDPACFSCPKTFTSKTDAILYAVDCYSKAQYGQAHEMFDGDNTSSKFWVGTKAEFVPKIDTNSVLEQLEADDAEFTCDEEHPNLWLGSVTAGEKTDLDKHLQEALQTWMDAHNRRPNYYVANEVEEYDALDLMLTKFEEKQITSGQPHQLDTKEEI